MKVLDIELEKITEPEGALRVTPSDQSIAKLAASIKQIGLINPITVKVIDDNKYEVIAGHRRFLSCKSLNLKTVPCNVVTKNERATDVIKITENMERKQLTDFEGIMAMTNYANKYHLSLNEFCEVFQITKGTAQKYITLSNAQEDLQAQLHNGDINMQQALELMTVKDDTERMQYTQQCIEMKWSAVQLKQHIANKEAMKEYNKYQEEHREEIAATTPHLVEYINCQMCDKEVQIEDIQSIAICPSCMRKLAMEKIQNKIQQEEKRQEA